MSRAKEERKRDWQVITVISNEAWVEVDCNSGDRRRVIRRSDGKTIIFPLA